MDNEEISSKITRIDDNIGELKKRIDEIQQSLLLLGDDVQKHDEEQDDTEKKITKKIKKKVMKINRQKKIKAMKM